jgi:hypothetical protein
MRITFRTPLAALAMFASLVPAARAQSEEGVFSSEGVQLHTDARVHTLYGVLNARGYDQETDRGPQPTVAPRYHAIRTRMRDKLKLGTDVEKSADAFLQAHADSPVRYLRAALELEDAPRFGVPEGASLGGYEGLAKVLNQAWPAGVAEAYEADTQDLRKAAKEMLPKVDASSADLRKLFHQAGSAEELLAAETDGAERVVVVLNPLDSHGVQLRHASGTTRYVVLGPWNKVTDKGVMDPVVVELARMLAAVELKKAVAGPEAAELFKKAGPAGAALGNAEAYATEVFARAAARKVLGRALTLRTGLEAEADLPGEVDLAKALDAYAAGTDKLADALPGLFAAAAGNAPAATPTPAVTPTPAPKAADPVPPVEPKKTPAPAKGGKPG